MNHPPVLTPFAAQVSWPFQVTSVTHQITIKEISVTARSQCRMLFPSIPQKNSALHPQSTVRCSAILQSFGKKSLCGLSDGEQSVILKDLLKMPVEIQRLLYCTFKLVILALLFNFLQLRTDPNTKTKTNFKTSSASG